MRLLYAADKKFRPMLDIARQYAYPYKYREHIYNIDNLGYGFPWLAPPSNVQQLRYWKAQYMYQALITSPETVVWMDADSLLVKGIDEFQYVDYDVGIVVLPKGQLSSAFMVLAPTDKALSFIDGYADAAIEAPRGDLKGLNRYMQKHVGDISYKMVGETIEIEGVKVALLDGKAYHHKIKREADLYQIPEGVKVLHFSGNGQTKANRDSTKLSLMMAYDQYIAGENIDLFT